MLSDAAAAKLVVDRQLAERKLKLRIEYLEKKNVELMLYYGNVRKLSESVIQDRLKIANEAKVNQKEIYEKALDRLTKASESKWYRSPYLHFFLGALMSGGIAAAVSLAN